MPHPDRPQRVDEYHIGRIEQQRGDPAGEQGGAFGQSSVLLLNYGVPELLADQVLDVLVVLRADVLDQLGIWHVGQRVADGPGLGVGAGIVDGDFQIDEIGRASCRERV